MAISRYQRTSVIENDDLDYQKVFAKRYGNNEQATSITQYGTIEIDYPKMEAVLQFNFANEFWRTGDRLYKY